MDEVVGVELNPLEDEIVKKIERVDGDVEVEARVGIDDVLMVPVRPRPGIEREHRPAHEVEEHLHVEAVVEALDLLSASEPQRQEAVLLLAFWLG